MKKLKTVLLAAAAVFAFGASGDALMWMVEDPVIHGVNGAPDTTLTAMSLAKGDDGPNYVRLVAIDSNGALAPLNYYDSDAEEWSSFYGISIPDADDPPTWTAGPVYADVSSYKDPSYSFMIEIGNYDEDKDIWKTLAVSDIQTYNELYQAGHISPDELTPPELLGWTGGTYYVPEPTGGMLIMFGLGLLALRRRRITAVENA